VKECYSFLNPPPSPYLSPRPPSITSLLDTVILYSVTTTSKETSDHPLLSIYYDDMLLTQLSLFCIENSLLERCVFTIILYDNRAISPYFSPGHHSIFSSPKRALLRPVATKPSGRTQQQPGRQPHSTLLVLLVALRAESAMSLEVNGKQHGHHSSH